MDSTGHMMAFFYAHIICSLGSPRGGGGVKPYCLRLSLRQSAIGTYCVGLDILYGVFLCTLNFYLAAQGGGGVKPPKPPPPVDPPLGGGGGAEVSCPNIFSSLFARKWPFEKLSEGAAP